MKTHSYISTRSTKPAVVSIAGSDSAGMAGIQADNRCYTAMGVHGANVISTVTAQNNVQVIASAPVDQTLFSQQLEAVIALNPQAIKIGLLGSEEQVEVLAEWLPRLDLPVIFDPVLNASSGHSLVSDELFTAIKKQLIPLCTVITPNLSECARLTGTETDDLKAATQQLLKLGAEWIVIKGGHREGIQATDYVASQTHSFSLSSEKVQSTNARGTGCGFSSFIASTLALGYETRDALVIAKMAMQDSIIASETVNDQLGPVSPTGFPTKHWPTYSDLRLSTQLSTESFPSCVGDTHPETLGLYPIVDRAHWLDTLLPAGITTIQLRIKDLKGEALENEIEQAVAISRRFDCRLFINDYWQLAIEKGAYGVHLGQEDLETADFNAIRKAGLRLGLSNHSHFELVRSMALKPSYIACGPIFATTTKIMPWIPHGIDGLKYWASSIDYPLVAIAGIDHHNIEAVAATGVSGIAMITAITQSENPAAKSSELSKRISVVQDTLCD